MSAHLGIVTATIDPTRAEPCIQSWLQHVTVEAPPLVVVEHGDRWNTTVEAFGQGVDLMMRTHGEVEVICCLHDDLVIFDEGWDAAVLALFDAHPDVGLAGFVGVEQVDADLRRHGVRSRFVELGGEPHAHSWVGTKVASVDGVALLGRRAFWSGFTRIEWRTKSSRRQRFTRPWPTLAQMGFTHYWTDDALGCLAKRGGWDVYYLPMRGRHLGGLTIRDPRYRAWAADNVEGGDRGFYEAAHRLARDNFQDVLPLRPDVTTPTEVQAGDDASRRG